MFIKITLIFILFSLISCGSNSLRSEKYLSAEGVEDLVTCRRSKKSADVYVNIQSENGYTQTPNNPFYYTPNTDKYAFGMKIVYISIAGVNYQPGENASLIGSVTNLVDIVSERTGNEFECKEFGKNTACVHKISDEYAIAIFSHETQRDLSTIQCAYFGL